MALSQGLALWRWPNCVPQKLRPSWMQERPQWAWTFSTDACPHYLAVEIHGVSVQPSPDHAQRFLRAIGVQPINNVVDATNMVLHEFGNPLHALTTASKEER